MNTEKSVLAQTFLALKKEQKEVREKEIEAQKRDDVKYTKARKLIRDEFELVGKYEMPLIRKQPIELDTISLMGYNKVKSDDTKNTHTTIHFFTYDWNFDNVYDNADKAVDELKQYYAVLTPDFSLYVDMPLLLQMYSTFKNRWCGAYWQAHGMQVIPTVEWSDERSFKSMAWQVILNTLTSIIQMS